MYVDSLLIFVFYLRIIGENGTSNWIIYYLYNFSRRFSLTSSAVLKTSQHLYSNVGWIINSEVSNCMVCTTEFGMFTYQHHCKACGNVVGILIIY